MSLLMEALRKAAQVKKQTAGNEAPSESPSVEGNPPAAVPETPPARQERSEPPADPPVKPELKLERADDERADAELSIQDWEISREETEEAETPEAAGPAEAPNAAEAAPMAEQAVSPSEEGERQSSRSEPGIPSAVEPAPQATPADVPGIESIEASKRAARSVFIAKKKHQRQARRRQTLVAGAIIGLILLGGAGYYFLLPPNGMKAPAPTAASKSNTMAPLPAPPAEEAAAPATAKPAVDAGKADGTALAVPAPATDPPKEPALDAEQAAVAAASSDAVRMPEEASRPAAAPIPVSSFPASSPPAAAAQGTPEATQGIASPDQPTFSHPPIQIIHHRAQPQSEPQLTRAYAAYQRGDFSEAGREYGKVERADPGNRGALLGLAAIALRSSDTDHARSLYLQLLERNPSDPLARVGLLSLMPANDPVKMESELKLLLSRHPDVAPLYFFLGNLYAESQRWSDAEEAYFNAWQTATKAAPRPDAVSPDYPFNLAVSLEHLNQYRPAARYYREALQLAGNNPAGFDKEALRSRLEDMSTGTNPDERH